MPVCMYSIEYPFKAVYYYTHTYIYNLKICLRISFFLSFFFFSGGEWKFNHPHHSSILLNWQWIPEMRNFCPKVPYVLVGCKTDLREDAETIRRLRQRGSDVVREEEVRPRWCMYLG